MHLLFTFNKNEDVTIKHIHITKIDMIFSTSAFIKINYGHSRVLGKESLQEGSHF